MARVRRGTTEGARRAGTVIFLRPAPRARDFIQVRVCSLLKALPAMNNLTLAVHERVATLTVNRPDKLNALNAATLEELGEAVEAIRTRDDIAAAIVTGAGRAFVAGADIRELAQLRRAGAESARGFAERGQGIFDRIETSPKPIVAAVNGFALGGGCELALACHFRIAADTARFGQPEVKLGTVPGYGGTQRLPRIVGRGRALELLLTGEIIDAQEAWRIGLVNRVVTGAELLAVADAVLRQILANGPLAIAACIDAVNRGAHLSMPDALAIEARAFGNLCETEDMAEGTTAFLEKRAPAFHGH